jgi:hypothetical protein
MLKTITARMSRIALGAGVVAALAAAAAVAQPSALILPQPGEVRLTLSMGARTVAFPAKMAPIARETIPFETGGHAVTQEGREAMVRLQEALFRQPGGSLVLVVYGEDETLAFQRAKAVRGELAERHSMDPARIIASGRKAAGHQGDLAVVDVYGADATRCGGCNGVTFRTLALDSATLGLVTLTPETLPQAAATPAKPATLPAVRPTVAARTVAPAVNSPAPAPRMAPLAVEKPAATAPKADRQHAAANNSGSCAKPRIIIDDYYPGGPIVPCRVTR